MANVTLTLEEYQDILERIETIEETLYGTNEEETNEENEQQPEKLI